ncbi:3-deoxy-manno-octulosonate cytidylyltransferase [Neptuniibacter pectenicola]|uniref:3-deoxy-manno-octulosonate cytidylyltransferase n=1 Tax=Neptuniibacter pectenicola TaxID=1806669 RepID=A0ABU9TW05_9GAMM
MKTVIVIPARYGSSRLPGKPLADIHGKPMIQNVYEKAVQVDDVDHVVVATDDQRVYQAVTDFGGKCIITSTKHESGTDRLVEVMDSFPADIYINVQGDEPLIRPEDLNALVELMNDSAVQVGTLCHAIDAEEAENPNTVKVVFSNTSEALYFSRSPIPYARDCKAAKYFKHVGVYAYRREVLSQYSSLENSMLESSEMLEQLRLMSSGIRLHVAQVEPTGPGVDTAECLERVRAILSGKDFIKEKDPLSTVRLVITDVDGVLTDGSIFYDASGESLKKFHVRDGLGIRLLEESGIKVAVLSGRDSATLRKRIEDLGISLSMLGVKDKADACRKLMGSAEVSEFETVCIGDDSIDLPAFESCGQSFAVADAPEYVKQQATRVLTQKGGEGAFRELADMILTAKGKSHVYSTAAGFKTVMSGISQ